MSEILLGVLSGVSTFLVIVLIVIFNLFWSVASALLAQRRGRNACNWFFLSCIYGVYGLILLACSKTLNKGEYRESDTLAQVLWITFAVSAVIVLTIGVAVLQSIS